jgi:hypothetical protein
VPAVDVLARLDAGLQARSQSNRGGLGLDVATRLDYIRHPVAHGTMPDPFGDGLFYGLLASICIYGTPFFERPT